MSGAILSMSLHKANEEYKRIRAKEKEKDKEKEKEKRKLAGYT